MRQYVWSQLRQPHFMQWSVGFTVMWKRYAGMSEHNTKF